MNTQTIKGNWNVAKGKLKQKFSQLTDDDLRYAEGSEQELIGRLQKKTGQSREQLEQFLSAECGCDFSESGSLKQSSQNQGSQSQNPRPWETSSPRSGPDSRSSETRNPGSESRNPDSESRNPPSGQRGGSGQSGAGTPPSSNREQR